MRHAVAKIGTRAQHRHAASLERRAMKSGEWGKWRETLLPGGLPGSKGWCRDVRRAYANDLYAVLVRPIETEWGLVLHLAIRTASNLEPPWRDKQRIKDELFGPSLTAIEVMPPEDQIVDQADMYHMWVLASGFILPFTIWSEGQ
jgi:hypothetical protein